MPPKLVTSNPPDTLTCLSTLWALLSGTLDGILFNRKITHCDLLLCLLQIRNYLLSKDFWLVCLFVYCSTWPKTMSFFIWSFEVKKWYMYYKQKNYLYIKNYDFTDIYYLLCIWLLTEFPFTLFYMRVYYSHIHPFSATILIIVITNTVLTFLWWILMQRPLYRLIHPWGILFM